MRENVRDMKEIPFEIKVYKVNRVKEKDLTDESKKGNTTKKVYLLNHHSKIPILKSYNLIYTILVYLILV